MNIVDTIATLSTTPNPRRPVRVPQLVSSTKKGEPYARAGSTEAQIARMLSLPRSRWVVEAPGLKSETLVFLIRRTHRVNDEVCGGLLEELQKRIEARARRFAQGLDEYDEEELVMNVEGQILGLVLIEEPSRNRDFLEIAFAKVIKDLALNHLKGLENSPMGHLVDFVETDEEGEEVDRPIEFVPDEESGPEEILLNLDTKIRRHRLLQKALKAVQDPRHREAVILHHGHGIPVTSTQRGKKSLTRHFRKDARQIKYWIATAMKQMRHALGVKSPLGSSRVS